MNLFQAIKQNLVALAYGDYVPIRDRYASRMEQAILDYLYAEKGAVTRYKNEARKAITDAIYPAFYRGIEDGGGQLPATDDEMEVVNAKLQAEYANIDGLFAQLKDLKAEAKDDPLISFDEEARARASGYARTLDGVYGDGKIRGAKNKMLTFDGEDGVENCATCRKYKGQRHRASWWVKRGLVIYRGNDKYECGCWQCQHRFVDDKGVIYTF